MDSKVEEKYGWWNEREIESQPDTHRTSFRPRMLASRNFRRVIASVFILTVLLYYTFPLHLFIRPRIRIADSHESVRDSTGKNDSIKVPLEAHIMSKCPDAKDCLQDLVVPAMEQIHEKVDFKLSFIGTIDSHTGDVTCKHGPTECLGNILDLCAADLYPDPKIHLGFAMCMTARYKEIPSRELAHDCALEHGIAFDDLNGCISEEGRGLDLLEASVRRSADEGVKYSCTVRLNETVRCIRDGGEWTDCEEGSSVKDLVRDVEQLYDQMNGK